MDRFEHGATQSRIELLGVGVDRLTAAELLDAVMQASSEQGQTLIANVNVHAMNLAYEQAWYRQFLNDADLVFCDGFGVALGARLTGQSIAAAHRSTCPDWIEALARRCAAENRSLFLLAGRPGVAQAAADKLRQVAPQLRVAAHTGYFEKTGLENDQVIATINQFAPDLLYVGFGMPLQEAWIRDNAERLRAKVIMPLGACLDFYTGAVPRGPVWMTDRGLEWLSRLVTEPRRLWRRYLLGNTRFLWRVLRQRLTS